ncbi:MAG TPA: hypothetical protein VK203_10230, partial [Nostocaceae cyanobacterium]|nr:hypothetical protein [Nostocaceae cyanobacterium]
ASSSASGGNTAGQTPADAASGQKAGQKPTGAASGKKAGQTPASSVSSGGLATASNSQTTAVSPEQDSAFQAVITSAKGVAAEQKQHDPAEAKAQAAQDAAEPPSNEVDSKAQANQVGEMEQAETPTFDAAGFKAKLMQRIADMAPKNLEEADNFKNNNQLSSVKSELSTQVKEEQKASQEPLEEKTKEAPDKSGIEAKQVTPLPANEGGEKTPQDIGADKAAPKPKSEAEVEAPIQQDSQKLDQQMAEANITDEQLANSNEPQFQAALGAKKEAQTSAATAPQEYRQQEQDILTNAKTTAVSTAQQMLQGMQQVKAEQLNQVGTKQVESKGKDEQARAKVANDINQIYENTKSKVEQALSNLDSQVLQVFDGGAAAAKQVFEDYVSKRMEAYKKERYDGIIGKGKWVKDKLLGLPSEVNVFYQEGRQQYINKMDGTINSVVAIVSKGITAAKTEITKGKQEVQNYINKLPQDLKSVGQEAAADIQSKFEQLEENVNAKQDELVDTLAQKYQENLQAVDSRIDEMKAANSGLMQKALDLGLGVIQTINQLKDLLLGALAGAAGAVMDILKNPVQFLNNLVQAVKQGFMNFVKNIGQYLQQGLIGWLTGTLGESGIQMPESFDLKGVFSLVTQILGFTYEFIRGRAVQKIGEEKVGYLEKGEQTFQLLSTQGLVGVWHLIQDKIGDIKTMVIEGIKGFVISNIVQAGVQWVLSLLTPASAFVRACKMIIDIVRFFFERAAQIASLVGAITNSITAIASGSIGAAITAVEGALARSLPVVLGFLASLLGLGGIAQKIQGIIQKVRQPVTKAVDWIIDKGAKIANKVGGKFAKSKFGSKAIGLKNAAQQKYEAGKQWVENKKQDAQKYFDKKKQSLMDATEKQKQRFLNTKAGKRLTAVNDALNNKLDALEKKKEAFNQKLDAAKEWPNKQLEKVQDKAAEYRSKAKDKFKQSKVGQKLDQKWQDTKAWAGKKKESAQNWLNDKAEGAKDKFGQFSTKVKDKFGLGKDKNQEQPAKDAKVDEMTMEEKKEQLDLALTEAEQFLTEKDATPESVEAKLPSLKSKYKLKTAKLLKNQNNSYYIQAEINPKDETSPHELDNNLKLLSPINPHEHLKPEDPVVQELIADARKIHTQLGLDAASTVGTARLSDGSYIVATNGRGGLTEAQVKKIDPQLAQKYKLLTTKDVPPNSKTVVLKAGEEKQLEIQGIGEVKFKLQGDKLFASLNGGEVQQAELNEFNYRGRTTKSYKIDFNQEIAGKVVRVANLTVKPTNDKFSANLTTYPHAETNMRRYAINQGLELTHSGSDKPTCYLCAVTHSRNKTTFGDITKASPNWTPVGS